jgi:ABC-type Mn2+/Zn2+ transport system permease subunit
MRAKWYMSSREIKLCRVSHALFWIAGVLAGILLSMFWDSRPIEAISAAAILYFVALFIFDRVAERVIGDRIPIITGR